MNVRGRRARRRSAPRHRVEPLRLVRHRCLRRACAGGIQGGGPDASRARCRGGRKRWSRSLGGAPERVGGADPSRWANPHPLDTYVGELLDRADQALALARIGSRRFVPNVGASPALDFRALGELAGLGSMGPFGLLIHPEHGPWWALRGAWLVDVAVDPPLSHSLPCAGCPAPCVGRATTNRSSARPRSCEAAASSGRRRATPTNRSPTTTTAMRPSRGCACPATTRHRRRALRESLRRDGELSARDRHEGVAADAKSPRPWLSLARRTRGSCVRLPAPIS